jgi:hypothetical protein
MKTSAMNVPNLDELAQRLLRLEGDPSFERLVASQTRTNLFRIVGTTETERWHSAFWAWVLDPEGSHGLGDYALRRLLVRTADTSGRVRAGALVRLESADDGDVQWQPSNVEAAVSLTDMGLLRVLRSASAPGPLSDYSEVTARSALQPVAAGAGGNKRERNNDSNRFDILIVAEVELPERRGSRASSRTTLLFLVVEMKVNAAYDPAQLARYSSWLHRNPTAADLVKKDHNARLLERISELAGTSGVNEAIGVGVFMAPKLPAQNGSLVAPELLDPAWSGVTFAEMVADILEPALENPKLDAASAALIKNYVDLIASPDTDIEYMPREHAELVRSLINRHQGTFAIIAKVLSESEEPELQQVGEAITEEAVISEAVRKAESLTPGELVDAGILKLGTQLKHSPIKNRKTQERPFDYDVLVELAHPSRAGFKLLNGPAELQGKLYTSTGVLAEVYKFYGSKFSASGNQMLRVSTGSNTGATLAELYERLRAEGGAD